MRSLTPLQQSIDRLIDSGAFCETLTHNTNGEPTNHTNSHESGFEFHYRKASGHEDQDTLVYERIILSITVKHTKWRQNRAFLIGVDSCDALSPTRWRRSSHFGQIC